MATLFEPIKMGELSLKNRVVMAPLTRCRASEGRVPNALMAEYYAQRASAGLIITEATSVTPMGVGYPDTPGIWSDEQVAGWKLITDAVHQAGGTIVMQLWHVGRISDPSYLNGELPVAPSAIAAEGHVSLIRPMKPYVVPRALELEELPAIIEAYRKGAENAKKAGFDGVEIHAANGYLLDQFLQSKTNLREDEYGGSVENRARFLLEVVDALIEVWGAGRVGVHLAPRGDEHDMGDANPKETFGYVMQELGKRQIAFFFTREYLADDSISLEMKARSNGVPYIANMRLSREDALELLASGKAEAVSFGKAYIANPDLFERLLEDAPLNELKLENMIGTDVAEGYIDYPFLNKQLAESEA